MCSIQDNGCAVGWIKGLAAMMPSGMAGKLKALGMRISLKSIHAIPPAAAARIMDMTAMRCGNTYKENSHAPLTATVIAARTHRYSRLEPAASESSCDADDMFVIVTPFQGPSTADVAYIMRAYMPHRHQPQCPRHPHDAGFTLVELLVVLAILVLLATFVGPRVIGYLGSSRTQAAKVQIESISTSLELFRIDAGRLPTAEEGLKALVSRPAAVQTWNGPYLKKSGVPLDPWGRPYIYRVPGQHGEFDILTLGADNAPGGGGENSDVGSW